jgi:succinate dehydrogenase / fumarate reductase membrane anchor subunit
LSRRAAGLKAWAIQRATAIYLTGFFVLLLGKFTLDPPTSHLDWRLWVADPLIGIATMVFFTSLLFHAWVGVRDVLMDYVKPITIRATLLTLAALTLLACGLWAAQILILVRLA